MAMITDIRNSIGHEVATSAKAKTAYKECKVKAIEVYNVDWVAFEPYVNGCIAQAEDDGFECGFNAAMKLIGECFSANKMQPDTDQSNQGCTAKSVM